ncbi:hypothetical protein [Gluconacetobacter asukensis]|uniref:Uncharacterized protein n=2 Tax=Gluconacetobacter asukensis TaxID=1017181 RepID=A0A7W4J3H5_9PROT|nr:hypothetical protein [Gluconacetobacter asukensis]MBB2174035.1 hypothetical protein [Gluconacetobacter asukensis]
MPMTMPSINPHGPIRIGDGGIEDRHEHCQRDIRLIACSRSCSRTLQECSGRLQAEASPAPTNALTIEGSA